MEVSSSAQAKSMICRYLRAMSLDKLVEMKFQLAGVICGATLISPCTERLDCQNHDNHLHAKSSKTGGINGNPTLQIVNIYSNNEYYSLVIHNI
jgi:hypothetical protein